MSNMIDGYELIKPTMGKVPSFMRLAMGDQGAMQDFAREVLENCTLKDGKVIGPKGAAEMELATAGRIVQKQLADLNLGKTGKD